MSEVVNPVERFQSLRASIPEVTGIEVGDTHAFIISLEGSTRTPDLPDDYDGSEHQHTLLFDGHPHFEKGTTAAQKVAIPNLEIHYYFGASYLPDNEGQPHAESTINIDPKSGYLKGEPVIGMSADIDPQIAQRVSDIPWMVQTGLRVAEMIMIYEVEFSDLDREGVSDFIEDRQTTFDRLSHTILDPESLGITGIASALVNATKAK